MSKPDGIVRITIIHRGKVVGRDAIIVPPDKVLSEIRLPLSVGRSTAEVLLEFEPAVRPE